MIAEPVEQAEPAANRWSVLAITVLAVSLAALVSTLPEPERAAAAAVAANAPATGLENRVTAVLLVFRGLDTLLEKAALLAGFGGVVLLAGERAHVRRWTWLTQSAHAGPSAAWMAALLLPAAGLTALYLLAIGGNEPGGAFQAGSVAAAAMIIAVLTATLPQPQPAAPIIRRFAYGGFAIFVAVSLLGAALEGHFMALPGLPLPFGIGGIKATVLVVEAALSAGVAATLFVLAMGAPPGTDRA